MTIARAALRGLRIPLSRPVRTAGGPIAVRTGFLLELEDRDGCVGYGEALPLPHFGGEHHAACEAALRALPSALVGREVAARAVLDPRGAGSAELAATPVARNLYEIALLDLYARSRARPLAGLIASALGLDAPASSVEVSALVSGDAATQVARSATAALGAGHRCFKLKVGVLGIDEDEARVAALRECVGPAAELRVDANGAWRVDEALRALGRLAKHGIALVEQPVAADDLRGLLRVAAEAPMPVAADEALRDPCAARRLLEAGGLSALILKLPPLGGPAAVIDLAAAARRAGVAVSLTSFLDSSLGIAAALHVAAALRVDSACGLATADRLAGDLVPALQIEDGRASLGPAPGLGPPPQAECLSELAGELLVEACA